MSSISEAPQRTWNRQEVNEYLANKGLTDETLRGIRRIPSPEERLYEAGYVLAGMGWYNFSVTDLAMVVSGNLWSRNKGNTYARKAGDLVRREYQSQAEELNKGGLNTNSMHLFRENVGAYHGNLAEARSVWNFEAGKDDWRDSIRLPLRVDDKVAQFLGIIWGDANIQKQTTARNPDHTTLFGDTEDFEFYKTLPEK